MQCRVTRNRAEKVFSTGNNHSGIANLNRSVIQPTRGDKRRFYYHWCVCLLNSVSGIYFLKRSFGGMNDVWFHYDFNEISSAVFDIINSSAVLDSILVEILFLYSYGCEKE